MISVLQHIAFTIHSWMFCYAPGQIVTWDAASESLQFTKSRLCKTVNLLLTGHLIAHSLLCFFSAIYLINHYENVDLVHCSTLFLSGGCFGIAVCYNLYWFVIGDVSLHSQNAFAQINRALHEDGNLHRS